MRISLATSLHLNHGGMTPDHQPGDRLLMQAFVPVGLLCLKSVMDHAAMGVDVRVTEVNTMINRGEIHNDGWFYERLVDAILNEDDALVGLMTDADSLHHTIVTAHLIKRRSPETVVCLGGPAASPMSRVLLESFPFIDVVVRGEGEFTFVELVSALKDAQRPSDVLGLTWRLGDRIVENPARPLLDDLDELPVPAFEAYDMVGGGSLYLDVGRGCPFKCHFCATAPFWNRKYRMKSIERIVREIELIRDRYGRRHVNFSHDIFTCDRAWTLRFCTRLIEQPLGVTWTCSTRTDIIDPDVLAQMAQAGCVEIYYGIESGSAEIQRKIHKDLDLDWSREIVRATRTVGIRPITGFIVGYPFETLETLRDTLGKFFDFLQVGGTRAHLFTLCPFHESPMYHEYGHTVERPAEYYDLPLDAGAQRHGERWKAEYPTVFASTSRFASPDVPAPLVDASEELSSQLVVLKALWPLLLPHYDSALDWYTRWAEWIRAHNETARPGTMLRHQGTAWDLLRFVDAELERLGLVESDVAALAQYEALKLRARVTLQPAGRLSLRPEGIAGTTVLRVRCEYLAIPFEYDLQTLLRGERAERGGPERWVICAKTEGEELTTMQVGITAKCILDGARRPAALDALLAVSVKEVNEDVHRQAFRVVQEFVARGLLEEVEAA